MRKTLAALTVLAGLAILLSLVTCGDDSVAPPPDNGDPLPQVLSVSLAKSSGMPMERIRVTGIPANVTDVYASVLPAGTSVQSRVAETRAFIHRAADGDFLIAPINPAGFVDAGSVTIQVTNGGSVTSNDMEFAISALPPATGEFSDAVAVMQRSLDGWLRIHGTSRTELRGTAVTALPPQHLPLLVTHQLVDNPDNPNSLRSLADGDIPLFTVDASMRDLLDRVVAAAGVVAHLNTIATLVDTLSVLPPPGATGGQNVYASSEGQACITAPDFGINNCFKLSGAMNKQYQIDRLINSATRSVENSVIFGASVALAFLPGGAGVGGAVGAMVWTDQKGEEALANLMPSFFDPDATSFLADPERFKEDEAGPGRWKNFKVTAKSKGWSIDQLVLEAIMQVVGLSGGQIGNILPEAGQYGDALTGLIMSEGTNNIIGEATNGSSILSICPRSWTVDCTDPPVFLKGTVITGDAITVDNGTGTYSPVKSGQSGLRVETKDAFGEAHTGSATLITVDLMNVSVQPAMITVRPGAPVDFTATVTNAVDNSVIWTTTDGSIIATGPNTATLITPGTAWTPQIQVKARSSANTGARTGNVDSDPREGLAIVSAGDVEVSVSPAVVCVKRGETQPFEATVTGATDESVIWSVNPPGAGSMEGNIYTAPGTDQDVTVVATSVEDPSAWGASQVEVGSCICKWDATFVGNHTGIYSGEYAVRIEPQGFNFSPTQSDLSPFFGVTTGPVAGVGTYDVAVTFSTPGGEIWSHQDPDVPVPQLVVTLYGPDKVEGSITGELHQIITVGPPAQYRRTSFDLRFRAAFFDPLNPSNPCE